MQQTSLKKLWRTRSLTVSAHIWDRLISLDSTRGNKVSGWLRNLIFVLLARFTISQKYPYRLNSRYLLAKIYRFVQPASQPADLGDARSLQIVMQFAMETTYRETITQSLVMRFPQYVHFSPLGFAQLL